MKCFSMTGIGIALIVIYIGLVVAVNMMQVNRYSYYG